MGETPKRGFHRECPHLRRRRFRELRSCPRMFEYETSFKEEQCLTCEFAIGPPSSPKRLSQCVVTSGTLPPSQNRRQAPKSPKSHLRPAFSPTTPLSPHPAPHPPSPAPTDRAPAPLFQQRVPAWAARSPLPPPHGIPSAVISAGERARSKTAISPSGPRQGTVLHGMRGF